MIDTPFDLRPATPGDAPALAQLIDIAGGGMPGYAWAKMAAAGETARDVGRRLVAGAVGDFSYRNAVVATLGGKVVGCLNGFPIPESPAPIDAATMPAPFLPLQELENVIAGSWFIDVVAAFPQYRNQGIGGRLLADARRRADAAGRISLGLIVSDANAGARRLYERHGFRAVDSRPMVKEGWVDPGRNWILMTT